MVKASRLALIISFLVVGIVLAGFAIAKPVRYSCSDTDSGKVAETIGTVSGYSNRVPYNYTDKCVNTGLLREYYCSASRAYSTSINCTGTQKICKEGVCTSAWCGNFVCEPGETQQNCPLDCVFPNSCSDSDGGSVITVFGTTSGYLNNVPYSHGDYCADVGIVNEYNCSGVYEQSQLQSCGTDGYFGDNYCMGGDVYRNHTDYYCVNGFCSSNVSAVLQQDCVSGQYCNNGQCSSGDSCLDSDGGNKIMILGTASGYYNNTQYSDSDYCVDANSVREYFCSGVYKQSLQQSCGNDSYSQKYCIGSYAYKNYTDYYCANSACTHNVTPIAQQNCDGCTGCVIETGMYFTDFESDNGWIAAGIGQGKFEIGIPSNFSPGTECVSTCLGTGINGDHTPSGTKAACTNLNGHMQIFETVSTNSLTSPVYNFTGKANVSLELWRFMEIEGNNYDFCYYQYKDNLSGTWKTLETYGSSRIDDNSWTFYTKDMRLYADNKSNFQLRFYCTTDDWTEGSGLCVDDIKLSWGSGSSPNPNVSTGWRVTSYLDVNEKVYLGNKTEVFNSNGITLGYYKNDFLEQVQIDGSGKGDGINNSGKYLHYDYSVDDGKTYYLSNTTLGAWDNPLIPWTGDKPSIAINPPLPRGTTLRFVDLGPDAIFNTAWVNALLLNKTFYVDDKFALGANNQGKYIDVYIGLQPVLDMSQRPESLYLRNVSVVIS